MLSSKMTALRFSDVKGFMLGSWWEVGFFKRVGNAVAAFFVEYVVVIVVSENLVEVDLASDTDDLAAGVTAAVVVVVAFVDVVFDYDYIVCVAVDVVVVAGYVVLFVVVALDDASEHAAAYFDA